MTAVRSIGATARNMPTISARPTCAVRLIDRRTGSVHRVNGTPLVVFTRNPDEAVADLLQHHLPLPALLAAVGAALALDLPPPLVRAGVETAAPFFAHA